jgi:tRNA(Arg) A34 adenosine deaminase TadA
MRWSGLLWPSRKPAWRRENCRSARSCSWVTELLAMIEADERLGWSRRPHPLRLAVTLEPCLMCLGAAMSMGISEVFYSLNSPGDGAAGLTWQSSPEMPWYTAPTMTGGIRRGESRSLFRRYCQTAPDSGFRLACPSSSSSRAYLAIERW